MIIISELPYSLHLGSNKNRKNSVRSSAKNNISGTTSMTNNGIQNAKTLSKCDKHNYRKYDNEQEQIVIVKGTSSLYKDVEDFYKTEFEEARLEYNNKQKRDDRKIDDYFKKVSDNSKSDLACEIIIELGDKKFWDTKDLNYTHKMTNVYSKQVDDLELLMPNFKVCSAIIHYDETSPHMHIVGVPIKYNCKTGMSKQVGKTDVFTRTSLMQLQDKMRTLCIEEYNKEYNLDATLKQKMKGRNRDINVADMTNYQETKELIEKHQKEIDSISNNSLELKTNSNNIKEEINKLKKVPLRDDLFIISKEQKNKLEDYIDKVDKTTDEYRDVKELSANLNIITKQARQDSRRIKNLKEKYGTKVLSTLLTGSIMMSMATAANAKEIEKEGKNDTVLEQVDNQYNVIVNGRLLKVNVLNYHADTYLPVRQIVESVNGEVNWQKAITYITINGKQYMVSPYSNLLGLADEVTSERYIIEMSKEVVYYNNMLYAPIEMFKIIGSNIQINEDTKTVIISKDLNYINTLQNYNLQEKFGKIVYDGVEIDQETAIILQQDTNNIVIETVDGLYIYSYQYMSEIEYQGKFDSKVLSK